MNALCLVASTPAAGFAAASAGDTIVQLFQWRWTDVAAECCDYLGIAEGHAEEVDGH